MPGKPIRPNGFSVELQNFLSILTVLLMAPIFFELSLVLTGWFVAQSQIICGARCARKYVHSYPALVPSKMGERLAARTVGQ